MGRAAERVPSNPIRLVPAWEVSLNTEQLLSRNGTSPPALPSSGLTGLLVSSIPRKREDDTHGPHCPRRIV
ncbi:hypothetical protein D3C71_1650730 [compost metagenome]